MRAWILVVIMSAGASLTCFSDSDDSQIPEDCTNGAYDPPACERCVWGDIDNPYERCLTIQEDDDLDDILNPADNCRGAYNPLQHDQDGDGEGSTCDIFMGAKCEGVFVLRETDGQITLDMANCPFVATVAEANGLPCAQVRNGALYYRVPDDTRYITTQFEVGVWRIGHYCQSFEDGNGPTFTRTDCVDSFLNKTLACGWCDTNPEECEP